MINKANLKFYLIPTAIFFILLAIILVVPLGNKKPSETVIPPSPTGVLMPKSSLAVSPAKGSTPTLIPLQFTGGALTDEFPAEVKLLSEQKMELRRKTPLNLPFGTIGFDYGEDQFTLTLIAPIDTSRKSFDDWLKKTYPALPVEQFAIQ